MLIKDTHSDSGLCGQVGVVRGVTPGMCSVFLPEEDRTVNVAPDHLQPVHPLRGDKVKVILGKRSHSLSSSVCAESCSFQARIANRQERCCPLTAARESLNWIKPEM